MTQLSQAKAGRFTEEIRAVARKEKVTPSWLRRQVARGAVVIPANPRHLGQGLQPTGIGSALSTKINANFGTSPATIDYEAEMQKLAVAVTYGADTVMDLSTGGDVDRLRKRVLKASPVPVGTVPVYQAAMEKSLYDLGPDDFLKAVEKHCRQGVDYITVHAGVTRQGAALVKNRVTGIVSRGGGLLAKWMQIHEQENPYYTRFEEVCDIAFEHDVTLSLGDGLRPGCIADATDAAQLHELKVIGRLAARALERGVQAMIEGPGHVPLNQIPQNVALQRRYCGHAPFYVLGPLVTDIAPGYDHITGSMGALVAAYHGAALLCYVTPAEHLRLPSVDDVREGVVAFRIAAHAADLAKGVPGASDWDERMSRYRKALDWRGMFQQALDPHKAMAYRRDSAIDADYGVCSMCGSFCPLTELPQHVIEHKKREKGLARP